MGTAERRQSSESLMRRPWVSQRFAEWIEEGDGKPMLLLRGDPGTGKSSALLQLVDDMPEGDVVACVSRAPFRTDQFDTTALLRSVIDGLYELGFESEDETAPALPEELAIDMDATGGSPGTVMIGFMNLGSASGLLPVAERLIRQVPAERRVLIVVDGLDQAEDDQAEDFLKAVAALLRAANGSGVRLACASRRVLPVNFDSGLVDSFDLIGDMPESADDLREYLQQRFEGLDPDDRERVVSTIVAGAADNWLWATTNAGALEGEIEERGGSVPDLISLSGGLEGLYEDGVRRMRQRADSEWVACARPILIAVAAAFDEHLTVTELRWITGRTNVEIEDVVRLCAPFLRRTGDGVGTFHPDFARWVLAGNVDGSSEEEGHLAVARGFTALGRENGWNEVASTAAARVLEHWGLVLLLDPFSPTLSEYEKEIDSILADRDWLARTTIDFDTIDQIALAAPTLRFPDSSLPLSTGLQILRSSAAAHNAVGFEIASTLSGEKLDDLAAVIDTPALAIRWLEKEIPSYTNMGTRVLWDMVLCGRVVFTRVEGELRASLSPDVVLATLDRLTTTNLLGVKALLEEVDAKQFDALVEAVEELAAAAEEGSRDRTVANSVLGDALLERIRRRDDDADGDEEDLTRAVAAYRNALEGSWEGEYRIEMLVRLVNCLRRRDDASLSDLDVLVEAQGELADLRKSEGDESWPVSRALLGDAFRLRAKRRREDDPDGAQEDRRDALCAYREAMAAYEDADGRLRILVESANTLIAIDDRTDAEVDELIELQSELLALQRRAGGPSWPQASLVLGDAFRDRFNRRQADDPDGALEDLRQAVVAYRDAKAATPREAERRPACLASLANALMTLDELGASELDELIDTHAELLERSRNGEEHYWPEAALALGNALVERAQGNPDTAGRAEDLERARELFREILADVPPDGERPLDQVIGLANVLMSLDRRSDDDLEELIDLQGELLEHRRQAEDQRWPEAAAMLARAYRERALRGEEEAKAADLKEALSLAREARGAVEKDDLEVYLTCLGEIGNALRAVEERSAEEIEEMVDVQREAAELLRESESGQLLLAYKLLGDAYRARADARDEDDEDREDDLRKAMVAYGDALAEAGSESKERLPCLVSMVNAMLALKHASDAELDDLIELLTETLIRFRAVGYANWPLTSAVLGSAYRERAERQDEDSEARGEDLQRGLACLRDALAATPAESESRLSFLVDLTNALIALDERSDRQLNELIASQAELLERRRQLGQSSWADAAGPLAAAYRERSKRRMLGAAEEDLARALAVSREALAVAPAGSDLRFGCLVDVAGTLMAVEHHSESDLDELIEVRQELVERRRAMSDRSWTTEAKLLGDAYMRRARQREDDAARTEDLALALGHYREAVEETPAGNERRLSFVVSLANAMVVHAAVTRQGDRRALDEAIKLVNQASGGSLPRSEVTTLIPVLRAALQRDA